MTRIAPTLLMLLLAVGAQAQPVWRCTAPHGVVYYAESACAGGQPVAVADPRSPEQVQDARRAAAAERELARRLVDERQAREREWEQAGAGMAGIRSAAPAPIRAVKPKLGRQSRRQHHDRSGDGTLRATARASRPAPG